MFGSIVSSFIQVHLLCEYKYCIESVYVMQLFRRKCMSHNYTKFSDFYILFGNALQHKCRTPGPTACLKLNRECLKVGERRKNSMTWPRQPRTRSHSICAWTLKGVYQAVRMFSPCYFHRNSKEWLNYL